MFSNVAFQCFSMYFNVFRRIFNVFQCSLSKLIPKPYQTKRDQWCVALKHKEGLCVPKDKEVLCVPKDKSTTWIPKIHSLGSENPHPGFRKSPPIDSENQTPHEQEDGGGGCRPTRTGRWWWWWQTHTNKRMVVVVVADPHEQEDGGGGGGCRPTHTPLIITHRCSIHARRLCIIICKEHVLKLVLP